MVSDRLSLAVLIGCDIDGFGLFGKFFQFFDGGIGVSRDRILGNKVPGFVIYGDAKGAFRQVTGISIGVDDLIVFI